MTASRRTIDLNADLGEGFPWDEALLERVTSASISCGAHAGDEGSIERALRGASARGVSLGAHPGYPDRANFGRREQSLRPSDLRKLLIDQVDALRGVAARSGATISYVKPHGALYNQAQRDPAVAVAVLTAVDSLGLPVVGMPGSILQDMAAERDVRFVAEGFADRRYGPDGLLVPRELPGAILDDPAEIESQVLRLIVEDGVDTICLHGDHPGSIKLSALLQQILSRNGIDPRSFLRPA